MVDNINLINFNPTKKSSGLWISAYHLIHPNVPDTGGDRFTADETSAFGDTLEQVLAGGTNPSQLLDWSTPDNPREVDVRLNSTHDISYRCGDGARAFGSLCSCPTCVDAVTGCLPTDADGNVDVSAIDEECLIDFEKKQTSTYCKKTFNVPIIYASNSCTSTFNAFVVDPWKDARENLKGSRSKAVEKLFLNGAGAYTPEGVHLYGCLAGSGPSMGAEVDGAPVTDSDGVVILNAHTWTTDDAGCRVLSEINPVSPRDGLAAIEEQLCCCLDGEAGMIHANIATVVKSSCGLQTSMIDYGDGMGQRQVLTSKYTGNIMVPGAGYCNALGPDGRHAPDGSSWIYGTSMVQLVWDNIHFTIPEPPNTQELINNGLLGQYIKDITDTAFNSTELFAEQLIGAVFNPCCRFAVLVDNEG